MFDIIWEIVKIGLVFAAIYGFVDMMARAIADKMEDVLHDAMLHWLDYEERERRA